MNYLITLFSDQQPRRIRVIENILNNKRTVTTLFWGMRYQILPWLATDRQLNRKQMDDQIQWLVDGHLLQVNDQRGVLTQMGKEAQTEFYNRHYQPHFLNYYLWFDTEKVIRRLMLAAQVVSEYSYQNNQYAPFSFDDGELKAVKIWFSSQDKGVLVHKFKQEITECLNKLPAMTAELVVSQLIGHHQSGESLDQFSQRSKIEQADILMMQRDAFIGIASIAISMSSESVLRSLLQPLKKSSLMSSSTEITYRLFNERAFSVKKISQVRRLKIGTVREHLLEAAIFTGHNFPYQRVIDAQMMNRLNDLYSSANVDNWKFSNDIDADDAKAFFYFRLYQIMRSMDVNDF